MRIFLDTANIEEIREGAKWGIVSGVTTNPSLMAKEKGADFKETILEIASIIDGPISAEVTALDTEGMVEQARPIAAWHPNVVIKVPVIPTGLAATKILAAEGIRVNMTLVFTVNQAILAALAGASYVSPFVGRMDDISEDGMAVVRDIVEVFSWYGFGTEVLAASIRHTKHVVEAAKAGADIATVPFAVLKQMVKHPLTDIGLEKFLADWKSREAK